MRFNCFAIIAVAGVLVSTPLYPKDIVKCPTTLGVWLKTNFNYQKEEGDYWKTPSETAKDKGGDCEDLAFFVEYILKDLGYETKVLWVFGWEEIDNKKDKYSHAICAFKLNDKWRYFSNEFYFDFKDFNTIQELITFDCKNWIWYSEISLDKPNQTLQKHWK